MLLLTVDEILDDGYMLIYFANRQFSAAVLLKDLYFFCHAISSSPPTHNASLRVILEMDAQQVASRVALKGPDMDVPLAEQTFTQALETAKQQFIRSFR